MNDQTASSDRESMDVDVVVVGAGPAGLATACRLIQLSSENGYPLAVDGTGERLGSWSAYPVWCRY